MRLPFLLAALLAAPVASAQPAGAPLDSLALARADSLLRALLDVERDQLGDAEVVTLAGEGGALTLRRGPDGAVTCSGDLRVGVFGDFSEMFCLSALLFETLGDGPEGDGDFDPSAVSLSEASWEGGPAHVIRLDDPDDEIDRMELWVADGPLRLVQVRVEGTVDPGLPMSLRLERGDFREASGVVVPHAFRLVLDDPAALLAAGGVGPRELLAEAQRRAPKLPPREGASLLTFAKAAAAGRPYEFAFTVDRGEVDGQPAAAEAD
jgi:hypothetical protein